MKPKGLNKRGDVRTIVPTELVGYILAAILCVLVIIIIVKFTLTMGSNKKDEFAINNFMALANSIDLMSKREKQFIAYRGFPLYLPEGYLIIGFNANYSRVKDGCTLDTIRKPNPKDGKEGVKCEGTSCICLFGDAYRNHIIDTKKDIYTSRLMKCHPLSKVDSIVGLYMENKKGGSRIGPTEWVYSKEIINNIVGDLPFRDDPSITNKEDYAEIEFTRKFKYSYLVIYGECKRNKAGELGVKKFYIEKFTDKDKKTHIFIAPEPSRELLEEEKRQGLGIIDNRFEAMSRKYGVMPKEFYLIEINKTLNKLNPQPEDILRLLEDFLKVTENYFIEDKEIEIKKIATWYLKLNEQRKSLGERESQLKDLIKPIIAELENLRDSKKNESKKLDIRFILARLYYQDETAEGRKKAFEEIQKIIEENKEEYDIIKKQENKEACNQYDEDIIRDKKPNKKTMLECAHLEVNKNWDIEHALLGLEYQEKINIGDYEIKVEEVIEKGYKIKVNIYTYDKEKNKLRSICKNENPIDISFLNRKSKNFEELLERCKGKV